ncbi:MAG TPA: hypothetical protein PKY12_10690, partial [Catalimonadaceae bacterium]|nr:hypothetical protein [Catalimonadaceae bacterium]
TCPAYAEIKLTSVLRPVERFNLIAPNFNLIPFFPQVDIPPKTISNAIDIHRCIPQQSMKSASKKSTANLATTIWEAYKDHLRIEGQLPTSLFKFNKSMGMTETEF